MCVSILRKLLLTITLLSLTLSVAAQNGPQIIIQGQVLCMNGDSSVAQSGVLISATHNEIILSYTYTDEYGRYILKCNYNDNLIISAYFFGYKKKEFAIKNLNSDANGYSMNCVLEENAFVLDEVIVKPQNIEQDTINIKINVPTLVGNDNLGKVLQNSANFNIDENGSISYKGKPIHRILVDGDEFFYHQNAIALDKIELRMIDGIQVINNYSDKFTSGNKYNENETVLNLRANQQLTSVLSGSVTGGYGISNAYDAELSLMRFAKNNRGFLVNNTNNISQPTISNSDLIALFGDTRPISYIQGNGINSLFTEENRKKDLAYSSGLSYITQGNHSRLKVLLYYLYRNRANSKTYMLNDENTTDTYTSYINDKYRSNSGFITFNYDIKPKSEHVINYTFSVILTNPITDFDNDYITHNSSFYDNVKSYSFYNKLQYSYHVNDKMLMSLNTSVYNEISDIRAGLTTVSENSLNDKFRKNHYKTDIGLSYIIHPFFVLSVNVIPSFINENMHSTISQNNIERNYFHYQYRFSVLGQKVWDKLSYNLFIGYSDIDFRKDLKSESSGRIIGALKLTYENRLHRVSANFNKNFQIAPFNVGIHTISNNKLFYGDNSNLSSIEDSYLISLGYSYNSFITGRSFNISSAYKRAIGGFQFNLTDYDKGNEIYQTYYSVLKEQVKVSADGTIILLNQSGFPIKSTLGFAYSLGLNNSQGDDNVSYKIKNNEIINNIKLRSISKHMFNFEFYTNYMFNINNVRHSEYKSHHIDSRLEIQLRKNKFEGYWAYVCGLSWMFGEKYNRNNFDIGITYKFNNKFHLSFSGKNIDQFIPLFENQSYTTMTNVVDGVNQTILYTADINYLMIKLKYNF